jgi:hypothetical protein
MGSGGLAGQQLAVGAHGVGLRVDLHLGQVAVVHHVLLAHAADVLHGADSGLARPKRSLMPAARPACDTKVSEPRASAPP